VVTSAGAFVGPTATNTINGLIISSGALSGITTLASGAHTITATSTNALAVGRQGTTSPALQVDSNTALSVTGLKLTAGIAGAGFATAVVGGNTDEALTLSAKGAGTVTLASGSTGDIQFFSASNKLTSTGALTVAGAISGTGATLTGMTNAGVVTNAAGGALSTLPGTTTTVLHGNASGAPSFSSISGSDLSGSISISTSGNLTTTGSGVVTSAGAFVGPTATNTINGLIINSATQTLGANTLSDSGAFTISSAANSLLTLKSANNGSGASGGVTATSGTGTTSTGALTLSSGNASAGTAGNISLDVGTSSAGNGSILIGTAGRNQTITIGNSTGGTITIGQSSGSDLALSDAQWSVTGLGAASFASVTDTALTNAGVVTNAAGGALSTLPGTTTTVLHGNASGAPSFSRFYRRYHRTHF
jgi:hypothetical protein